MRELILMEVSVSGVRLHVGSALTTLNVHHVWMISFTIWLMGSASRSALSSLKSSLTMKHGPKQLSNQWQKKTSKKDLIQATIQTNKYLTKWSDWPTFGIVLNFTKTLVNLHVLNAAQIAQVVWCYQLFVVIAVQDILFQVITNVYSNVHQVVTTITILILWRLVLNGIKYLY